MSSLDDQDLLQQAIPWDGELTRVETNPVLEPDPDNAWETGATYNATATYDEDADEVALIYRAEDVPPGQDPEQDRYVSRLGLATSDDGIDFSRVRDDPVIGTDGQYAAYKTRGVEDPRITEIDDTYFLTYTAYNGNKDEIALFLATSTDLEHWEEHGPVTDGKAGAILDQQVNGEYIMYQGDLDIYLHRSDDGYDWTQDPDPVMSPREGMFDSRLVESGPAPRMTDQGILLIYNSCDDDGNYHVGAALFDDEDPTKLLARTDEPLLSPTADIDTDRRHDHLEGVVFCEGMVENDGQYILYFGSGDEVLSAATAPAGD